MQGNALRDPQNPPDAKHKFGVTCLGAHFLESVPLHPSMKNSVDVSRPGHTGMHCMTRISDRMQKHKFALTCPVALFVESILIRPEHEKQCRCLTPRTLWTVLRDPQIPPNAKTQVRLNVPRHAFLESVPVPP
jgi:hypothetical protein